MKALGVLRVFGPLAMAAVVVSAGASAATARAATPAHVRATRGAFRLFARTLPPGITASILPQTIASAATSQTALQLFTNPVAVKTHGVTYQMSIGAFGQENAFGQPPQMEVGLSRVVRSKGRPTAEQDHVYGYSASGMTLSANSDLTRLHLDTGSLFSPTAVNTRFTEFSKATYPCRLIGGGRGAAIEANGTLSSHPFRIATGTSPFFGTITTAPKTASAFSDPGCSFILGGGGGGGQIIFGGPQPLQTCQGRETIQAGSLFGSSAWDMAVGFEGGTSLVLATHGSSSQTESVNHIAVSLQPGSSLQRAAVSSRGAMARVNTTGNPMFGGQAVFFSHHAPRVSTVQACVWERHVHHYRGYRYGGGMSPVASQPLTALFDTGSFPFHGRAATLTVRKYLN